MKKLLSFVLLAAVLCTMLAGCHGTSGMKTFAVPESFDASRNYEITFWAKNDTNITQIKIYEKAIEEFQEIYPNITVTLRKYTDYSKIYNDVITNIATDTTPNVCVTYPDHIATYLTGSNTVVPLDELFDDEKYGFGGSEVRFDAPSKAEVVSSFLNECIVEGHYYAVPFMRSTEACYINKTLVEKLGYELPDVLTWDFIWEVSDAAVEKDEEGNYIINGQKTMIPFIYKSTDNMMIQMLKQLNAGYSTEEGEVLLFNDTTKDLLNTVSTHTANGAFSTFKISSYPGNFLNAGQCIFAVDSTAGATWMGAEAPLSDIAEDKIVEFELVVRPVPQFDTENAKMISQGPSVCIFNKDDPNEVLASWLFVQYLLSDSVQIAYSQTEGYIPVTTKAQQSEAYQDYLSREGEDNDLYYAPKIQVAKMLIAHLDDTFVTPVFTGSASLRDAAGQLIEAVAKSTRRKQTIDDTYMQELYSDTAALYRLDQIGENSSDTNGKQDLGPLHGTAVALICTLCATWVILGVYLCVGVIKKKHM